MSDATKAKLSRWQDNVLKWLVSICGVLLVWIGQMTLSRMGAMSEDVDKLTQGQSEIREKMVEMTYLQQRISENKGLLERIEERVRQLEIRKNGT